MAERDDRVFHRTDFADIAFGLVKHALVRYLPSELRLYLACLFLFETRVGDQKLLLDLLFPDRHVLT